MSLVTRTPLALEISRRDLTNRVTTFFTPVRTEADLTGPQDLCYTSGARKTLVEILLSLPETAMTFDHTRRACYAGYITQAIVNNLAPLLFIVFQTRYAVPYERLGRLVLLNFATQLLTDLVAVTLVDRTGYRLPLVLAHGCCVVGLVLLAVLPSVLSSPYLGLSLAIVVYAIGGGLLEVVVSPVVEALPSPQAGKAAAMSLLHSFYCWGQVAVVLGTTLLLAQMGQAAWQILPLVWAVVPLMNLGVLPAGPAAADGARHAPPRAGETLHGSRVRGATGADGVRRGHRVDHVPMVLAVRRAGLRPAKGLGRPRRSVPVRGPHGARSVRLRPLGSPDAAGPRAGRVRHARDRLLPHSGTRERAGTQPARVCAVRAGGQPAVAGHVQPRRGPLSLRRRGDVRPPRGGRRRWRGGRPLVGGCGR